MVALFLVANQGGLLFLERSNLEERTIPPSSVKGNTG